MNVERRRQAAVVLLVIAATAGGLAMLVGEFDRRERDRHAVLALVEVIEAKLRAHDMGAWLLAERPYPLGEKHSEAEPTHEQLRVDLDRLAHLQDLRLVVVDGDLGPETATADYRVEGKAPSPMPPSRFMHPKYDPVPSAGQFTFRREGDGWILTGHKFLNPPTGPTGSSPSPVRPGHRHGRLPVVLAFRLAAIAGLAFLGTAAILLQPVLARVMVSLRDHMRTRRRAE